MQQAIDTFKQNIESVKQLDIIYQYLQNQQIHNNNIDLSELLRAEIVLAVSALDNFISDVLRIGIVDTFDGTRTIPHELKETFNKFQVDMEVLLQIISAQSQQEKLAILGNYITKINEKRPYQTTKQIEEALALLGIKQLWTKVSNELSMNGTIISPDHVKRYYATIIFDRNKIAHEADIDPLTRNKRNRDRETTFQAIIFLEKFCNAVFKIVTTTV